MTSIHIAYLGIGSNISPEEYIVRGVNMLRQAVTIEAISSIWETPPVGGQGGNFLNAVARISTNLTEDELIRKILRPVEARLGRVRTADPNTPRTIDLDVLIFDQQVRDQSLWELTHICVPLAEIYPDYTHPDHSTTIVQVAERLQRGSPIVLRYDIHIDLR